MSQTITITLELPDGVSATVTGVTLEPSRDQVEEYFVDYLSPSGRKLYRAAANIERHSGPGFTFEDIAANLSVDYESAKSFHRNSGRTAARWERERGSPVPVRLDFDGNYGPQEGAEGWRSRYSLPEGVAEKIIAIPPTPGG
jgi:hypothetical protein